MSIRPAIRLCATVLLTAGLALAQSSIGPITTSVPNSRKRIGTPGTLIAPGYKLQRVVDGSVSLENPAGPITKFGFLSTGALTEPDENTYLVLDTNPGGPTSGFDYGRHFVFQGHENSANGAYITRVNLDVTDPAHKVTLLTPGDGNGVTNFNSIDGSTFDPFTSTLLFTQETGANGGVIEVSTTFPASVHTLDGIIGKGGFEGIHPDDLGSLLIVEDAGGTSVSVDPTNPNSPKVAKQPNSFVYRFLPADPSNLSAGGKLQALRVNINGQPLVFHAGQAVADVFSLAQLKLHTRGTSYPVDWVTVHDTAVDGTTSFSANAAAKTAGATPFKRPENAQFLPGSNFLTFFFDPTGDTDAQAGTSALARRGSWGSIFRVDLDSTRNAGKISIFVLGDADHASFDNLTFADDHTLLAAEDRGDTLHLQLNKLDSVWAFATDESAAPGRLVALGRDGVSVAHGEDNEPTGLHVSAGGTSVADLPGTLNNLVGSRAFLTRQHGENQLWEIIKEF
jgi:Bacterial protein of unknown function (DUF839)